MAATTILLATGVVDRIPAIRGLDQISSSLMRWCPICDAYEVTDQSVALLAPAQSGAGHVEFLRTFTAQLTLCIQPGESALSREQSERVTQRGIRIIDSPVIAAISDGTEKVGLRLVDGETIWVDAVYPMIGYDVRADLATALGANCDADGDLVVDADQQTSVRGLYAAGDIVNALNQMSVGVAHAAIAVTAIHNALPDNDCEPVSSSIAIEELPVS